jgi:hypothetical protein
MAYCLQVIPKNMVKGRATGLTPRAFLLSRYTQPNREIALLLAKLGLGLPPPTPPRHYNRKRPRRVVKTYANRPPGMPGLRMAMGVKGERWGSLGPMGGG